MLLDSLIDILHDVRKNVLKELAIGRGGDVLGRGAGGDLTYRVDVIAERAIIEGIKHHGIKATLISEESGIVKINGGGDLFVIDPLDGSTNAIRGIPVFSCSIAVARGERFCHTYLALVMNLVTGNTFYAKKKEGAFLDGNPIKPSSKEKLNDAVIEIDLNIKGTYVNYLERIKPVIVNAGHVRFLGSDALALCLVACGASDAFIDLRGILRATDIAAGAFIAKEAGAIISSDGRFDFNLVLRPDSRTSIIAAGNKKLFYEILSRIS